MQTPDSSHTQLRRHLVEALVAPVILEEDGVRVDPILVSWAEGHHRQHHQQHHEMLSMERGQAREREREQRERDREREGERDREGTEREEREREKERERERDRDRERERERERARESERERERARERERDAVPDICSVFSAHACQAGAANRPFLCRRPELCLAFVARPQLVSACTCEGTSVCGAMPVGMTRLGLPTTCQVLAAWLSD